MNTNKFDHDGNKSIPVVIYIIVIAIIALVGLTFQATTNNKTVIQVEYRESVYRNFTIIEDNYNNQGFLSVVEIDLDDKAVDDNNVGCDGAIENDNAHNCVIVDHNDIRAILSHYNLSGFVVVEDKR